jgi:hypothetical protein
VTVLAAAGVEAWPECSPGKAIRRGLTRVRPEAIMRV